MRRRWSSTRLDRRFWRSSLTLGVSLCCCLSIAPSHSNAEDPPVTIARIEEDWEMKLLEPDPSSSSPQVTFFTRPSEHEPNRYFQTQLSIA